MKTKINDSYTVYMHQNKINSKVYIGITSQSPKARWGPDGKRYLNSDTKFSKAIKKYDWDNFEHIILETEITKEDACSLERELIKKYNSYNCGYNSTLGGDGRRISRASSK